MFSVSAKTQYAIRAMAHLARLDGASATASEIAVTENIPLKFLEGILTQLKASGLVSGERGKNGGYHVDKAPGSISMLSIVEAIDGSVRPVNCVETAGSCAQGGSCLPRKFWLGLKDAIDAYLGERTLKDIAEG